MNTRAHREKFLIDQRFAPPYALLQFHLCSVCEAGLAQSRFFVQKTFWSLLPLPRDLLAVRPLCHSDSACISYLTRTSTVDFCRYEVRVSIQYSHHTHVTPPVAGACLPLKYRPLARAFSWRRGGRVLLVPG